MTTCPTGPLTHDANLCPTCLRDRAEIAEARAEEAENALASAKVEYAPDETNYGQWTDVARTGELEHWKRKAQNRKVCCDVLNRGLARKKFHYDLLIGRLVGFESRALAAEARAERLESVCEDALTEMNSQWGDEPPADWASLHSALRAALAPESAVEAPCGSCGMPLVAHRNGVTCGDPRPHPAPPPVSDAKQSHYRTVADLAAALPEASEEAQASVDRLIEKSRGKETRRVLETKAVSAFTEADNVIRRQAEAHEVTRKQRDEARAELESLRKAVSEAKADEGPECLTPLELAWAEKSAECSLLRTEVEKVKAELAVFSAPSVTEAIDGLKVGAEAKAALHRIHAEVSDELAEVRARLESLKAVAGEMAKALGIARNEMAREKFSVPGVAESLAVYASWLEKGGT